ncbi:hypothetical protein ACFLUB_02200 [Chloroflexota bacterium]
MKGAQPIVTIALKAVALAMGVASIVLAILRVSNIETYVMLLSVGLFALALAAIMKEGD